MATINNKPLSYVLELSQQEMKALYYQLKGKELSIDDSVHITKLLSAILNIGVAKELTEE